MLDLSTQIETLYRVIGQIRPASDPNIRRDAQLERPVLRQTPDQGALRLHNGATRPTGRAGSIRWTFKFYCFWFSLPLTVWFSSGWIGLFVYWRALSCTARLVDFLSRMALFTHRPSFVLERAKPLKAPKPRPAIELEAQ
jgi:hypothetical protein